MKYCLVLIVWLATAGSVFGKQSPWEIHLWHQQAHMKNEAARALVLAQLAAAYRTSGLTIEEDSVMVLASDAVSLSGQPAIAFAIHKWYASKEEHHNPKLALLSVAEMLQLGSAHANPEWQADAHAAAARLHLDANRPEHALAEARQAWHYATMRGVADNRAIDAWVLLGESQEKVGDKEEAFRSYLNAQYAAAKTGSLSEQSTVLAKLSAFYRIIGDYSKAKEYRKKQIQLDRERGADSASQMRNENEWALLLFRNGEWEAAQLSSARVIAFAKRTGNKKLLDEAFQILRTQLVENGKIAELRSLYLKEHPDEFRRITTENPLLHHRLMAFFAEQEGKPDEAAAWYAAAEKIFPPGDAMLLQRVRFQQRYGEFLLRQGDREGARQRLKLAYNDAEKKSGFAPFAIQTATLLDSLAKLDGDYVEAYRFSKLAEHARMRQEAAASEDKLLQLELETEARTRALDEERLEEKTRRRHNLQYTGIIIGIALAFLIVLLLPSAHVSPRKLRIISFLTFILLFEFIILIADGIFHHWTHGEPWQMILLKLVFIAGLSQVHHWMEHRLAHYLATHQPLTEVRRTVTSWWKKDKQHQTTTGPIVEPTESTDEIF
jgi:hypothetical protein